MLNKLSDELSAITWDELANVHDAHIAYDLYHAKFCRIYNDLYSVFN